MRGMTVEELIATLEQFDGEKQAIEDNSEFECDYVYELNGKVHIKFTENMSD